MADKLPLKLVDAGSGKGELREFASGDAVPIAAGGTGATSAAAARAALGAGTSSLTIGTTSTTAKAGNYTPTSAEIAAVFAAATSKTTPIDADALPLIDSAASNGLKKLTWANLKATLKTYFDTLYAATGRSSVTALTIASGVVGINHSLGDYFTLALSANVTSITFSNLPGSGKGASLMVSITQGSTARTVAWPASFIWEGGAAGAVSTASGAVDLLAITTFDNGTTWHATLSKGRA